MCVCVCVSSKSVTLNTEQDLARHPRLWCIVVDEARDQFCRRGIAGTVSASVAEPNRTQGDGCCVLSAVGVAAVVVGSTTNKFRC